MPFSRPTLTELRQRGRGFFNAFLTGADTLLRFSNIGVVSDYVAGAVNGLYGYLDWIAKQAIPYTATGLFLEMWAGLKGVTRKAAVQSTGVVTFTGTATTVIPSGTVLVRSDQVQFVTTGSVTIGGGGSITANVQAQVGGIAGNTAASSVLKLASAIAGVDTNATVTTAIASGADAEDDSALRARMLEVYQNPPEGGAADDYVIWATQAPGVTRAWCVPLGGGVGTVYVYFMMDVTESIHGGFPQGTDGVATAETRDTAAVGDQLTVANYIYPLRPVTALVYAKAPIANTVNFTIAGISGVSAAVKTAIGTAIDDLFLQNGSPGGTIYLSDIEAAIASVAGTDGFIITTPSANVVSASGHIPVRGTMTWT